MAEEIGMILDGLHAGYDVTIEYTWSNDDADPYVRTIFRLDTKFKLGASKAKPEHELKVILKEMVIWEIRIHGKEIWKRNYGLRSKQDIL